MSLNARLAALLFINFILAEGAFCQDSFVNAGLIFSGVVFDAKTLRPLPDTRITRNRDMLFMSDSEGSFSLRVNRNDTLLFSNLGYKPARLIISDTLSGREFIAGVYLQTDTLMAGEVIISPRLINLKSEIFSPRAESTPEADNARFNLAVSAYQGRQSVSVLGDPSSNYEILRQKQKIDAYEKGGIPSDRIAGLSPFMLIPAAYLLLNGFPQPPPAMKPGLTQQEINQIHRKYIEKLKTDSINPEP